MLIILFSWFVRTRTETWELEKDWLDQIGEDEKAEMEEVFILVEWGEVVWYMEVMVKMKGALLVWIKWAALFSTVYIFL